MDSSTKFYRVVYKDELCHHGILGMKWGIRRYQNPDGSLTEDGKKRRAKGMADAKSVNKNSRNFFRADLDIIDLSTQAQKEGKGALIDKKTVENYNYLRNAVNKQLKILEKQYGRGSVTVSYDISNGKNYVETVINDKKTGRMFRHYMQLLDDKTYADWKKKYPETV